MQLLFIRVTPTLVLFELHFVRYNIIWAIYDKGVKELKDSLEQKCKGVKIETKIQGRYIKASRRERGSIFHR